MGDASAVGIMDGAFFVPKSELLAWLSNDFKLSLTKVEQCASGAVYIQIVDRLFPGKVPMGKVKWDAKLDYEYIKNYKLLQQVFDKCDVKKFVEVDKLIRGKAQDNLEFLQWMKAFYDRLSSAEEYYDPVERRLLANCPLPDWAKVPRDGGPIISRPMPRKPSTGGTSAPGSRMGSSSLNLGVTNQTNVVKQLKEENSKLLEELETAERERNFYFGKLQELEVLCQTEGKESLSTEEVQLILYAEEAQDN